MSYLSVRKSSDELRMTATAPSDRQVIYGGLHLRLVRPADTPVRRALVSGSGANRSNARRRSDFTPTLTPPAFSTSSTNALDTALIVSSRSAWRLCGGLLSWQPSDLTRWWVSRIALQQPWSDGRRADHHWPSHLAFRAIIGSQSLPMRRRPRDFAAARISLSSVASGRARRCASSR